MCIYLNEQKVQQLRQTVIGVFHFRHYSFFDVATSAGLMPPAAELWHVHAGDQA